MKHKKIKIMVLSALILAGTGMGLMASGQPENTQQNPTASQQRRGRAGRHGRMMYGNFNKEDEITVKGKLYYKSTMHPELKTDSAEYELLVPRFLIFEADIKEGTEVSITGYKVDSPPMDREEDNDNDIHIYVTKAVINGKTYDIGSETGAYCRQGAPYYSNNGRPGGNMHGWGGGKAGRRL